MLHLSQSTLLYFYFLTFLSLLFYTNPTFLILQRFHVTIHQTTRKCVPQSLTYSVLNVYVTFLKRINIEIYPSLPAWHSWISIAEAQFTLHQLMDPCISSSRMMIYSSKKKKTTPIHQINPRTALLLPKTWTHFTSLNNTDPRSLLSHRTEFPDKSTRTHNLFYLDGLNPRLSTLAIPLVKY